MKQPANKRRMTVLSLAAALALALSIPVSASIPSNESATAAVTTFSKNTTAAETIHFNAQDFKLTGNEEVTLDSVILTSLPSSEAGFLMMGDQPLVVGDVIAMSAVEGMRFCPSASPTVASTTFSFIPVFSSGSSGDDVTVNLYLLTTENGTPVAKNLEFNTYKNVAYTGQFSAVDPEGDLLTFQLVDKPARGSLAMPEEGGTQFIYTPYENKTGKDSFTYVAIDAVGNTSAKATVKLKIDKASTKVTYADMIDNSAYNAAIRLAEKGVYVGAVMDGAYYFQPELPVSRSEFLTMAMSAMGQNALEGITTTGFYDDDAISTWVKPYVSAALKSGTVQGSVTENGQVVFRGETAITEAEATVLLDRMLSVSDVSVESWNNTAVHVPSWASQAAMNMQSVGVIQPDEDGLLTLSNSLTRAEAAQMLAAALDVLENREESETWFQW